ncbi:MAG: hypothetical protein NTX56_19980 [Proteobacteria bacterium]|nr:hypothetical protein [Pseudomonadota bacterium]
MSPLWRDRLIVGLAPERLTAVRLGKGLHPRPIRQCEVRLEADSTTPWRPGVTAFQDLVRDTQWQTAGIEFVLSSHFVRYAVIPGDPNAQTANERTALGAIVFRKTFGNLCQDWSITLSETPKGLSTLGAAIPSGLLEDLLASVGKHCRIHSIRPDLMEAFNRFGESLKDRPAIFALVEPGRATIAQVADGAWKSITSRLTPTDDANAFAHVLEEEAALCPFPENAALWIRDLTGTAVISAEMAGRIRPVPAPWPGHPAAAFLA